MRRGLTAGIVYHWRAHAAVAAGVAVAAAVLTGALLVGDSMRGSLRGLVLDRLGSIDHALVAERPFREALAADLAERLGGEAATATGISPDGDRSSPDPAGKPATGPGGDSASADEPAGGSGATERSGASTTTDVRAAPALLLRGTAVHAETEARAAGVSIVGIDERFGDLYPDVPPIDFTAAQGQIFPSVVLNEALAAELGAAVGDPVLLTFERPSDIPRETVVGRADAGETIETLRLAVAAVAPDRGHGGFSLSARQTRPLNAFVPLGRLQRRLFGRAESEWANLVAIDAGGRAAGAVKAELPRALEVADLGLELRPGEGALVVESRSFVLSDAVAGEVTRWAGEAGIGATPVLTYLANEIRAGGDAGDDSEEGADGGARAGAGRGSVDTSNGDRNSGAGARTTGSDPARAEGGTARPTAGRSIPYSTVAALDPAAAGLEMADGAAAPALGPDEILLNRWAADELAASPGDEITLAYYVLGARDELSTATRTFRLAGVVELEGAGADPALTPEFPGMSDAETMGEWDPPFPVDLDLVRPEDEAYWERYRGTPKAFVGLSAGRLLWRSRFGQTTSIRLAAEDDAEHSEVADRVAAGLAAAVDPGAAGIAVRPLKEEGLASARGATDFAQLFLGLSLFLIASAALLVGLLYRLGLEARAKEVGLLRAVGYRERQVRRGLLAEGMLVAAVGAALGLAGAVGYAALLIRGLETWWLPAIGAPILELHVEPLSLGIGWLSTMAVVAFVIWRTLRTLGKVPPTRLLAGSTGGEAEAAPGKRAKRVAIAAGALAVALGIGALVAGQSAAAPLAFGIGAALLVAGLSLFAHSTGGRTRRANALGGSPVVAMGARNAARNRSRSLLSVALVGSAAFLIVVVASHRAGKPPEVTDRASGAGGFTLVAESDVPITVDLGLAERRSELGFDAEAEAALANATIVPFRLKPGDDVSCLNLYRPERPRLLGVPAEMRQRGGFTFQQTIEPTDDPWSLLELELETDSGEPGEVIPAIGDYNSVLWILHSGLGQEIEVENERGETVRLRLVGLLAKSLFQSELLISEAAFERHFPSQSGYGYFLVETAPERAAAASEALERTLGRFGFDATGTAEKLAAFQAVETTYLTTFQTLGGLGLLLGTVGLGIVLLRNVLERRAELATLRAFGFRRKSLGAMVVAENAWLLLAGIGIGAVAGLAAAFPTLAAAGHRLPWASLVVILALVFVVGLTSSLLAVAGSLRVPLLPALKRDR